jgi:hypothetical protein
VEFGKNVVGLDVVRISLKTAAAERMREATQGNGGLLALIPEGELLCTPYISGDISGELEINLALNHLQMIEAALRSDMAKE